MQFMRILVAILVVSLLVPGAVAAQSPSPAPSAFAADTKETMGGVTYVVPKDWSEQRSSDSTTALIAPEGDVRLTIVHVGTATDAKAAVAAAWKSANPSFSRAIEVAEPLPAEHGWSQVEQIAYVTGPEEHRNIAALAFLKDADWMVVLVDGSASTFEKRAAAINVALDGFQPSGYVRETFVGKTAHRLTPERVNELVSFVKTGMQELHVPGVGLALVDRGTIVYEGGLGVRQVGNPAPIDKNTLFMIASNTKGMTTLMLARVVDQGKLRWNEPVTQAYPAFRLGSPATTAKVRIEDLVCACTGVPRKDFDWLLGTTPSTGPQDTFTMLANTEPTSKYGEVFQYSNTMASAAGYIAGHIEYPNLPIGTAYDKAMQQLVFDPLGMTRTTLNFQQALASNHASPYGQNVDGTTVELGQSMNELAIPFRPAGEAWSSPHDMIQYVENELTQGVLPNGKRLVSQTNLLQRRVHTVPVSENVWYGMGLMDDRTYGISVVHHGGDLFGYHSDWMAIPDAGVGAVILTNSDSGVELRGPFLRRLLEVLYDGEPKAAKRMATAAQNYGTETRALRKLLSIPPSPQAVAQLASSYTNPVLGRLTVKRNGSSTVFGFGMWSSPMATRKNPDGTTSFMTIDPAIVGIEFAPVTKNGKKSLITRDGQHAYTYVASP
ncbi:MAG: beta-lactamase family protein [Candidatus Eremiobacteraeota bacterium]|nr:beta-lactamase family protein [Candidatus Eremiobacteraeota bacterium]